MNELADATVPAQPTAAAPQDGLPPPFPQVVAGQLPGVSIPPHDANDGPEPEAFTFAVQNFDKFPQLGLDVHETPNATTVIYNPKVVTADKIDALDKAGELEKMFPPLQDAMAPKEPVQAPAAPAPQGAAPGPLAGASLPAPAGAQSAPLRDARVRNQATLAPKPGRPNPVPDQLGRRAI